MMEWARARAPAEARPTRAPLRSPYAASLGSTLAGRWHSRWDMTQRRRAKPRACAYQGASAASPSHALCPLRRKSATLCVNARSLRRPLGARLVKGRAGRRGALRLAAMPRKCKRRLRGRPLNWEWGWRDAGAAAAGPVRLGESDSILMALLPSRLPRPLMFLIESFAGPLPPSPIEDPTASLEESWPAEMARVPRALRLTCVKRKRLQLACALRDVSLLLPLRAGAQGLEDEEDHSFAALSYLDDSDLEDGDEDWWGRDGLD